MSPKEPLIYVGPSMNPTIKESDVILLEPLTGEKLKAGDVVVFSPVGTNESVVHRVISVDERGIKTRGDNNSNPDEWVFSLDSVAGRVEVILRGGRKKSVHCGSRGRLYGVLIRAWNRVRRCGMRYGCARLWPLYNHLIRAGIGRSKFDLKKYMRFITIQRVDGMEIQLLLGGSVAGRLVPGESSWRIRRRFQPFVDENDLPCPCNYEEPCARGFDDGHTGEDSALAFSLHR